MARILEKKIKFKIKICVVIGFLITAINLSNVIDLSAPNNKIKLESIINDLKNPNQSSPWEVDYIHIDNNWSDAADSFNWIQGGDGSLSDPYIIENVKIDAQGTGSGIIVENSIDYFIIRNCIVYNSGNIGYDAGIKLINVRNSQIINNNCSINRFGIILYENCINNQIVNNLLNNNTHSGMYVYRSDDNAITGNTVEFNDIFGIWLRYSHCNTIENNHANENDLNGIFLQFCNSSRIIGNEFSENIQENGIKLDNSNNNLLEKNRMNKNDDNGIYLVASHNNVINENIAIDNDNDGINFGNSNNNWLKNNVVNKSYYNGIYFSNSHYNVIYGTFGIDNGNNAICLVDSNYTTVQKTYGNNNTHNGIYLWNSHENVLESNELSGNTQNGITLYGICSYNSIENNVLYNNFERGILVDSTCSDNVFFGNIIRNNTLYGVYSASGTVNNLFYENFFIKNPKNAYDDTVNTNFWNNSVIGNYWDNYNGTDSNDDGIGETPHFISPVGSYIYDYLPICDNKTPVIIVHSPSNEELFGYNAPTFSVTIIDDHLFTMSYSLGVEMINYTFSENGTINQLAWEGLPSGDYKLIFYAVDKPGNIGFAEVNISKDILSPQIDILTPTMSQEYRASAPSFSIVINEENLDSTWYTIDGGITNITFTGLSGVLDESLWSSAPNGIIEITFYANDTLRNLGFNSVTIVKNIPESKPKDYDFLIGILIGLGVSSLAFIGVIVLILKKKGVKQIELLKDK